MMTVSELSKITGVSIRTLQYYDVEGLLKPSAYTESGYRLYDDTSLERMQQILLFKELEFSLKEIKEIIDAPDFDKKKALNQQIELLTLKKEHLENLIDFARKVKASGGKKMDFKAFDKTKIDEYAKRAKEQWGKTEAFKEFEEKDKGRTENEYNILAEGLMAIFAELGGKLNCDPASEEVQALVKKLQDYITKNYYNCTKDILKGLGQMYAAGGEFTENIDAAGGKGTAAFANKAIKVFCNGFPLLSMPPVLW